MHTEPVNEQTSASEICKASDSSDIDDVTLQKGRLCGCPGEAPYFNLKTQKCVQLPATRDKSSLPYDLTFSYAQESATAHFVVDGDTCTSFDGYMSVRLDACTLACGEGFQSGRDGNGRRVCVCQSNEVYDPA